MKVDSTSSELTRIKSAYDHYAHSASKREAWSTANPGNRRILEERQRVIDAFLHAHVLPLDNAARVLEIGCGGGDVLASFERHVPGVSALYGMDLLENRIRSGHNHHPQLQLLCGDASRLPYSDSTFTLVVFFTVFTSILDDALARRIADEADRVLTPDGAILWYDFRYNNPGNPNVRGVPSTRIQSLFPDYALTYRTLTLLPPLARRLGALTPVLYPVLSAIPQLRTHICAVLRKRTPPR